nr:flavodoxin domain-containing protein [Eubacterium sp.]
MEVKIVYWSGTGNTQAMAEMVAEGVKEAGNVPNLIPVSDADPAALASDAVFALGCPAMGSEVLEESEMEPFMTELDSLIGGKKVGL